MRERTGAKLVIIGMLSIVISLIGVINYLVFVGNDFFGMLVMVVGALVGITVIIGFAYLGPSRNTS